MGLNAVVLQYVGPHEVGDVDFPTNADTADAARVRGLPISCLSRHLFSGMPVLDTEPGDAAHSRQMAELTHCLDLAREWKVPLVRITMLPQGNDPLLWRASIVRQTERLRMDSGSPWRRSGNCLAEDASSGVTVRSRLAAAGRF